MIVMLMDTISVVVAPSKVVVTALLAVVASVDASLAASASSTS